MAIPSFLPCDGCGQLASAEHIARRLQRLEWATRFRPIHVQALLLAASAPKSDGEFLYSPQSRFDGLAGKILSAVSIPGAGKSPEEVAMEFQKRGLYLAYVLECPPEPNSDASAVRQLLDRHISRVIARIRRSLKPKRLLALSPELQPFLPQLDESAVGCPVFYAPLGLDRSGEAAQDAEIVALRAALSALAAHSS